MASHSVSEKSDLITKVRALTGYEDTSDELPQSKLETLVEIAQLQLSNETGSEDWYVDDGLGQALLYTTAIRAKERVENYSVTSWTIGNQTIDVEDASDSEQAQFQSWAELAADGIRAANVDETSNLSMSNTSSYIG